MFSAVALAMKVENAGKSGFLQVKISKISITVVARFFKFFFEFSFKLAACWESMSLED